MIGAALPRPWHDDGPAAMSARPGPSELATAGPCRPGDDAPRLPAASRRSLPATASSFGDETHSVVAQEVPSATFVEALDPAIHVSRLSQPFGVRPVRPHHQRFGSIELFDEGHRVVLRIRHHLDVPLEDRARTFL